MKKLYELLETITAKKAEIDSHGKLNDQLAKRIQHKFRLDWNYYSNAMEGNSLTKIETKQLMMDNVTIDGKPFKDIAEMRGHDNEVLEIFKIGKGELRISEKRIKQMHTAIIHEEDPEKKAFIGQWKTSDNYLINYRNEKFNFLPFGEVKDAMHDLLNKTNADIDAVLNNKKDAKHPALIAFEFHLRYLEIHPFYDGNGRTGRLLLNLILISFGFPPVILDEQNRTNYYRILAEVQGYGLDPKECYTFLAELLVRSQDLVLDAIAGKEIEEDDDLIKEISLWKSQISHETSNVLSRTDSLIANVYKESIRPLFETYMNETKVFDDMFVEKITSNLFNKTYRTVDHLELFDRWFEMKDPDLITDRDNSKEKAMFILAEKVQKLNSFFNKFQLTQNDVANENEIGLHINWKGFKYNGTEAFQIVNEIKIRFDLYRFEITNNQFSQEKKIEKLYSEKLTQSEIKEFVNTVIKQLFEIIKQNVELTKLRRK